MMVKQIPNGIRFTNLMVEQIVHKFNNQINKVGIIVDLTELCYRLRKKINRQVKASRELRATYFRRD